MPPYTGDGWVRHTHNKGRCQGRGGARAGSCSHQALLKRTFQIEDSHVEQDFIDVSLPQRLIGDTVDMRTLRVLIGEWASPNVGPSR